MALISLSFFLFAALFLKGYSDYMDALRNELSAESFAQVELQFIDGRDLAVSIFFYCLVVALSASLLSGIFLSHRVAGPIYRLRKTLRQITQERKPQSVRFRKGDYTHELAKDFNDAMKALER